MISCRNLEKIYTNGETETAALADVSFDIDAGEFVAIMGPSGSGKSTLMHILGCLDSPTRGQYMLAGSDVSALSDDALATIRMERIGFVFQAFNLLPRASVLRNVMLPFLYTDIERKERRPRAEAALAAAAFPEKFWGHSPNELSGGMMQRVAIARALVLDPSIILADEPTGNLDTKTGAHVLATFQRLHREQGRTIILITHEPYVAEHAGRIIYVRDGALVRDTVNAQQRIISKMP